MSFIRNQDDHSFTGASRMQKWKDLILIEKREFCVDRTDYGDVLNCVSPNVENMTSVFSIINYIFPHPDLLPPQYNLDLEMKIQTLNDGIPDARNKFSAMN